MNGSFRLVSAALGSVALVIVTGCAKQTQPPTQPQTYESTAPEQTSENGQENQQPGAQAGQGMTGHEPSGQAQGQQPGMSAGAPGSQGWQGGQQGGAQQGGAQQGGAQQGGTQQGGAQQGGAQQGGTQQGGAQQGGAQQGSAQQGSAQQGGQIAPSDASEVQLCEELQHSASVRVENMANGAVLIMTPKSGGDLASVRQIAQRIEGRMRPSGQGAAQGGAQAGGAAQCALFDVSRLGASATIQESPTSIRLLLTVPDRANVEQVRRRAREFVSAGATGQDRTRSTP